jgi:glycine/D-amino acid oxidase-like deaminating enzyme
LLGWFLEQKGWNVLTIDQELPHSASLASSGVVNPVTGKQRRISWNIHQFYPFAKQTYLSLQAQLGLPLVTENTLTEFFTDPDAAGFFENCLPTHDEWLHLPADQGRWNQWFATPHGHGEIAPALHLRVPDLIRAWRQHLRNQERYLSTSFTWDDLELLPQGLRWKGQEAGFLISCQGSFGYQDPYFRNLPYSNNKGEALIVHLPGLPQGGRLFKKGYTLVPWGAPDHYWFGASFSWNATDASPTAPFLPATERMLADWVKLPFEVKGQVAAFRPSAVGRRPFVGLHPQYPQLGIFNGMGTKGCVMGPWYAHQLAAHLSEGGEIAPEVSLDRFAKLLLR